MARDKGLEELLNDSLQAVPGVTQKAMFGGWAWLVNGNLLCGARTDSMLLRLGRENETWAVKIPGVVPIRRRSNDDGRAPDARLGKSRSGGVWERCITS
jgi:hypothetical protein